MLNSISIVGGKRSVWGTGTEFYEDNLPLGDIAKPDSCVNIVTFQSEYFRKLVGGASCEYRSLKIHN